MPRIYTHFQTRTSGDLPALPKHTVGGPPTAGGKYPGVSVGRCLGLFFQSPDLLVVSCRRIITRSRWDASGTRARIRLPLSAGHSENPVRKEDRDGTERSWGTEEEAAGFFQRADRQLLDSVFTGVHHGDTDHLHGEEGRQPLQDREGDLRQRRRMAEDL